MFLSKLLLNPFCRDARRDVRSPYELHRTLARAFPTVEGTDYRAEHGVLFRIEPFAHAQAQPVVLVQSLAQPRWEELPEVYLLCEPETKPLTLVFSEGQTLEFRLMANPTKKEKRPGQRQGRRVALADFTESDELTPARMWLSRKGEQHGFSVIYATTEGYWLGSDQTRKPMTKNTIPIYGVRCDGLLQVTDPLRLLDTVKRGIGPSKAFGFGLLSLARPK